MRNETVLASLPAAPREEGIPCLLTDLEGNILFTFLYPPEQKDYSRTIEHAQSSNPSSVQDVQYLKTSGRVLRLTDLLMESYGDGKSLRPLIEKLESLTTADPENGRYNTPLVKFVWGREVFGPAVITEEISWKVTLWLTGEPAMVRLNMTLMEVPAPEEAPTLDGTQDQTVAATTSLEGFLADYDKDLDLISDGLAVALQTATQSMTSVVTPSSQQQRSQLSSRQQLDAVSSAQAWLDNNVSTLSGLVNDDYFLNEYSLSTNSKGEVSFINSLNQVVGLLGSYNGRTGNFNPAANRI